MISRRELLAASLAAPFATGAAARPNIVVLLTDDMGYGDPSCYGNKAYRTPNIDALAQDGTRFENFYAASAVCSPSRAAILTGRYPLRFDIRKAFTDDEAHLPVVANMASLLKRAGYATAHVGKWHLGGLHQKHIANRAASIPGPHEHGFDHYVVQNEEQPRRGQMGKERTLFRNGGTCLIRNERNVEASDPYYNRHFTDIVGDEAVRVIGEFSAKKQPFLLNVWFLDPHRPYEPAPEPFWSRAAAPGISDDQQRFRSMVMHADHKIGEIVAKLKDLGLYGSTLIVFTSDNGGAYEANIGPYKGGKTDLHEGGIRVPAIVSWPDRVRKGRTLTEVAHHCDLLPTMCAAAGVKAPAGDGVDLLPLLTGRASRLPARTLFWQIDLYAQLQRHYPRPAPYATEAVRRGKWKLLARDGRPVALFDLDADPTEDVNLVERQPSQAAALTKEVQEILMAPRDRSGHPKTPAGSP